MLNKKWIDIISKLDYAFQPIVNVKSGKIYAVEALLRNHHEAGGFYSIFNLFDEAFHDAMLYQLDLELRAIALKKFSKIEIENLQMFYNLDNRIMYMPDFTTGNTSNILDKLNFDKKSICFELSERGTLQDPSSITNMVTRYQQEGYDIAIDDFGTGIAGLQLLYYAQAKFIKLDRFFIQNIQKDAKKRLFCSSIINMAHIMSMKVIAEGVETKEEYLTCKDIGVDLVQGYLIQKPKTDITKLKRKYETISDLYKNDQRSYTTNLVDKSKIEIIEPLKLDATLNDLFEYFKHHPTNTFVPIIDKIGQLYGVIYEKDIKELSYSQFGVSLAKNDKTNEKLKKFIKDTISSEITWGVDKILEIYNMDTRSSYGIFITKNSQYYGFIDVNNLLAISYNRNIEIAKDQNPLSKLPGNRQIELFIGNSLQCVEGKLYHIVYFDFNDFKPFNDIYGFRQGDRAIILFTDILKKELAKDTFIAHIGGDDFFVGFVNQAYEDVYTIINEIQIKFREQVKELYNPVDKENEFIQTKDRFGVMRKFKLLGVCSAIIEIQNPKSYTDLDRILGIIKKESKKYLTPLGVSLNNATL
jgi:diguanylate cyclase (GGDEF)-like protein